MKYSRKTLMLATTTLVAMMTTTSALAQEVQPDNVGALATNAYRTQSVSGTDTSCPATAGHHWCLINYKNTLALHAEHNTTDHETKTIHPSPAFFWKRTNWDRYNFYITTTEPNHSNPTARNDGVKYIAHRGLVHMVNEIGENTLDAIQNAAQNHINFIELDIQASKDGKPVVTHDDSLLRTTGLNRFVNYYTGQEIFNLKRTIRVKNPDNTYHNTIPRFCQNGNQLMTLDTIYGTLQNREGYSRTPVAGKVCSNYDRLTYFLDPKNLASGQAVFEFLEDDTRSGTDKKKFYVKTYDNHWSPADHGDAARRALINVAAAKRQYIQVMPVINVRTWLDKTTPDYDGAVTYAGNIIAAWTTEGAVIGSVEFPGAWDSKWGIFVDRFYQHIQQDRGKYYGKNPLVMVKDQDGVQRGYRIPPVLAYGYRFPDYQKNTYNSQNGTFSARFWNWNMAGDAVEDFTNQARGTLGAQYQFTEAACKKRRLVAYSYVLPVYAAARSGCFVTTDFPHWEAEHNGMGPDNPPSSVATYKGSHEREIGHNF